MKHKAFWLVPFSVLLVTGITAADAGETLSMRVSPREALAPVNLRVSVRIEPHADNRALVIVADSSEFYRSSRIPLEGDQAPRVVTVEYPNIPGGQYDVVGMLVNSMGQQRATIRQTAHVIPIGGEP